MAFRGVFSRGLRAQRGTTGLETAIILIAFASTAAIFAYVVLSTGMFAATKSHEAATAGLDQVASSFALNGDVKANGVEPLTVSAVEGAGGWTASPNVTAATESSDYKRGAAGLRLTIGSSFSSGLVAYLDRPSTVNLSDHFSVALSIKATGTVDANVLRLVLDDSVGCGSPEETLNIPALAIDSWIRHRTNVADASALSAIACVGISAASDPGAVTLYIDQIEGPAEVQSVHVALENAIPTRGVAFVTTADSDNDGLLSDEATQTHYLIITYMSDDTITRDLTWTTSELGLGDGDNTLEAGETFILNIDLRAVDPIPTARSLITIDIATASEGSLTLEKIAPSQITPSMILN
jgi:archaellin